MNKWKMLVVMFLFLSLPILTIAEEKRVDDYDDMHSLCKAFAHIAESIMKERQAGIPMEVTIENLLETADASITAGADKVEIKIISDLYMDIIIKAYELPRYETLTRQLKAARDYRDQVYLKCVKIYINK